MNSETNIGSMYLSSAIKLFKTYKVQAEKAIAQLNDEDINFQANEDSNSVAIIVKHMHGNMLSRWTDFLTTDGEKPWRHRDEEFEGALNSKVELLKLWEEGWNCLFNALNPLQPEDLNKMVCIRGEEQTVLDSINRQLGHYVSHIGQIIFIAKEKRGAEWVSLTIPRKKR